MKTTIIASVICFVLGYSVCFFHNPRGHKNLDIQNTKSVEVYQRELSKSSSMLQVQTEELDRMHKVVKEWFENRQEAMNLMTKYQQYIYFLEKENKDLKKQLAEGAF